MIELINPERRFVLQSDPKPVSNSRGDNETLKTKMRLRKANSSSSDEKEPLKIQTSSHELPDRRKPTPYSFSKVPLMRMSSGNYLQSPESQQAPVLSSSVSKSSTSNPAMETKSVKKSSSRYSENNCSSRSEISEDSDVSSRDARRRRTSSNRRNTSSRQTVESRRNIEKAVYSSDTSSDERAIGRPRGSIRPPSVLGSSPVDRHETPKASVLNPPAYNQPTRLEPYSVLHRSSSSKKEPPRHISLPGAEALRSHDLYRGNPTRVGSLPATPQSRSDMFDFEPPTDRVPMPYAQSSQAVPRPSSKSASSSTMTSAPPRSVPSEHNSRRSTLERQASAGSALPYPDTEACVAMPAVQTFLRSESYVQSPEPLPMSRSPSQPSYISSASRSRPRAGSMNSSTRSSAIDIPVHSTASRSSRNSTRTTTRTSTNSYTNSSQASPSPTIQLSPCPRRKYSSGHDDWWTLEAFPNFDVCPDCLNNIIRPTQFRRLLVRARRPLYEERRCDFGSPWMRVAWLLTLKEQRNDFTLIYKLAELWEKVSPCPIKHDPRQTWWTLVDQNLNSINNFAICSRDKANIEILFKSLKGAFDEVIGGLRSNQQCSVWADGQDFPAYIDLLDKLNEEALQRFIHRAATSSSFDFRTHKLKGTAETRPLHELAMRLSNKFECPRDTTPQASIWHYIPDLPDLTVCPECYDAVIRNGRKTPPEMVNLFSKAPRRLDPFPGGLSNVGLTCQLYSPRMQKAWNDAAHDHDPKHIIDKMQKRRALEIQYKRRKADLLRMLKSSSGNPHTGQDIGRENLKRNLARIEREWQDYE